MSKDLCFLSHKTDNTEFSLNFGLKITWIDLRVEQNKSFPSYALEKLLVKLLSWNFTDTVTDQELLWVEYGFVQAFFLTKKNF